MRRPNLVIWPTVIALLASVFVFAGSAPAHAAVTSYFSSLSTPAHTDTAQVVRLAGRVNPATPNRPVSLYRNGVWLAGAHTNGNGDFAFWVHVPDHANFSFYSASYRYGGRTYGGVSTGQFRVNATYASSFTAVHRPEYPDVNFNAGISGQVWPAAARRSVSLYRVNPDGTQTFVQGAQTDANGNFWMTTRVTSDTRFTLFSARQDTGARLYDYTSSGAFLIRGLTRYSSSFSELDTPEFTNSGDQKVLLKGRVQPAAEGRSVSLYTASGDYVQGTTTDAYGRFSFVTTVNVITTFKFFSGAQVVGGARYDATDNKDGIYNFTVKSLRFYDAFDYGSVTDMQKANKWQVRTVHDNAHQRAAWDTLSFDNGVMTMRLLDDRAAPTDPLKVRIPHITTGTLPYATGHLEARIKFHRPKGAHGALWWTSGYGPGKAEIDVAEFFGERKPDATGVASQRIQHTVHYTLSDVPGDHPCGNTWTANMVASPCENWQEDFGGVGVANDGTWWNDFHTYDVWWSDTKFVFSIDGKVVGSIPMTDGKTVTTPAEAILSLLVNGSEYDDLKNHVNNGGSLSDYQMQVAWVRSWR